MTTARLIAQDVPAKRVVPTTTSHEGAHDHESSERRSAIAANDPRFGKRRGAGPNGGVCTRYAAGLTTTTVTY